MADVKTTKKGARNQMGASDRPRPHLSLGMMVAAALLPDSLAAQSLRVQAQAEDDKQRRALWARLNEVDIEEVEADVLVRGHDAVFADLHAGTWPMSTALDQLAESAQEAADSMRDVMKVITELPETDGPRQRGPGIGGQLARRLRKRR